MSAPDTPRMSTSLRRYADDHRSASQTLLERTLRFIGADIAFADDVLGDLVQERARRAAVRGAWAADLWYVAEALRSIPHLAWHAVRHGGHRGRTHVAALLAMTALAVTMAVFALRTAEDVPVRLEVDGQRTTNTVDGIVVHTTHPVRLAMRALDAKGNPMKSSNVRYRWASGAPVGVAANGIVTCAHAGDAILRASLGALAANVRVHCLPVKEVRAEMWLHLVAGGPPQELAFVALDPDGLPVNRLAGEVRVKDSTIVTLHKGVIRPIAPGHTNVSMRFGDGEASTQISVYEPIHSFEDLHRGQRFVVAPLRVARGDTLRWPLPLGLFFLTYQRAADSEPIPSFSAEGPIMCLPEFGPTVEFVSCLARGPGASLRIVHPRGSTSVISGSLSLERRPSP